ncbi:MAG: NAD(P)/FAD-dependent oxidoreductase [Acidimicrobiales bacterium]
MASLGTIVVAGASLAGFNAALALRKDGFTGRLVIVGDEPHKPYDRPPLSKDHLAGKVGDEALRLPGAEALDAEAVEWRLGAPAVGLELRQRRVHLADGAELGFDGLVIATGCRARTLPGAAPRPGLHVLRTLDDSRAVRAEIDAGARRVVVVGAGFIGAEVAATCRELGCEVAMVEALPVPLERAVGAEVGQVIADVHRDHGVDVRLGVGVAGIEGEQRVERVRLSDGEALAADLVVVGIGVAPAVAWLDGSGLELADGVVCDETCLAAPGVVAAGDVARWPNRAFGGEVMRVEHWDNAVAMGAHAARRLLAGAGPGEPYAPVPWFWSDQYDRKIQLAGRVRADDEVRIVNGSVEERRFAAIYGRAGRLVGVFGMNRPRHVMQYRKLIEDGASWEDALAFGG